MQSIRDIARAIIADMKTTQGECAANIDARHYQRLSVLAFSDFLRLAPKRSEPMNQQCLAEALVYRERAVALGAWEKAIEESFDRLRKFWIPRLGKAVQP